LRELREEYCLARKAVKSRLLDEAVKRTGLARKVVIRKLARPATLVRRPRAKRRRIYDAAVAAALTELWRLFDYPCGQRLVPLLREQVPRLRQQGWWHCPEEVAAKLVRMSAKTADRPRQVGAVCWRPSVVGCAWTSAGAAPCAVCCWSRSR